MRRVVGGPDVHQSSVGRGSLGKAWANRPGERSPLPVGCGGRAAGAPAVKHTRVPRFPSPGHLALEFSTETFRGSIHGRLVRNMTRDELPFQRQNGGVYVSPEILTTVIAFAAFLAALGTGFGWTIRRSDAQFHDLGAKVDGVADRVGTVEHHVGALAQRAEAAEARMDRLEIQMGRLDEKIDGVDHGLSAKIDQLDHRLSAKIDRLETSVNARLDAHERELTEIKIAIARLEGPRPHLVTVR